jgi:hypothetical protein
MDSTTYLYTLLRFYETCLSTGAVRLIRSNIDFFEIYKGATRYRNIFSYTLGLRVREICYIFPGLSDKNRKIIRKALELSDNQKLLISYTIGQHLDNMTIYIYDNQGLIFKKYKIKLFSINFGKVSLLEKSNASKREYLDREKRKINNEHELHKLNAIYGVPDNDK